MYPVTVPAHLALVARIAADRAVSTASVRFVHGILPEIEEKLSVGGRTEAYIGRDRITALTGLSARYVLNEYYERQMAEVGIVSMSRKGEYGMVPMGESGWRGNATRWIADPDNYIPADIPVLELESENYYMDVDRQAAIACLNPTTAVWAKNIEAYRLVMALIHHTGLKRVKLNAKQAAQILGKVVGTGWRILKRLEKLGLYRDGWVDYASELMTPEAASPDKAHAETVSRAQILRWSVFTKEGWAHRDQTAQWRESFKLLLLEDVRQEYKEAIGGKSFFQALLYVKEVMGRPFATGRPVAVEGW